MAVRAPIFPDIPDPAYLNVSLTEIDLGFLVGNISSKNRMLTGMSTVDDDLSYRLTLAPFGVIVNISLTKPGNTLRVVYNGTQESIFFLNFPPLAPITFVKASGDYRFGVEGAFFDLDLRVGLQPNSLTRVEIKELNLAMGLSRVIIFIEHVWIGDCLELPFEWSGIEDLIKVVYDLLWTNNPQQGAIVNAIKDALNEIIKDCTITDIIEFIGGSGDLSCLNLPTLPTTTSTPPTGTTSTANPTTTTTTRNPTTTTSPGNPTTTTSPGSTTTTTHTPGLNCWQSNCAHPLKGEFENCWSFYCLRLRFRNRGAVKRALNYSPLGTLVSNLEATAEVDQDGRRQF
jgi:hypothetical protein